MSTKSTDNGTKSTKNETKSTKKKNNIQGKKKKKNLKVRKQDFTWVPENPNIDSLKLSSIEKFPLKKVKILQEFLQDELDVTTSNPLYMDEEKTEWYKLNLSRINSILTGTQGEMFSSLKHVYHLRTYTQKNAKVNIGRLYSQSNKPSYMVLPREIRAFLASNEYLDFDIVNAHPTLLLEFVMEHMNSSRFYCLENYVYNRDEMLKEKAKKDKTSVSDAKRSVLKTLNTSRSHATQLGYMCVDLFEEIEQIRKQIVEYSKEDMGLYLKGNTDFASKSKEKQEISIQSLYTQTKETEYIVFLVSFLYQKTLIYLGETPVSEGQEPLLDRHVSRPD
jgi:hypothetical protein